MSLIRPEWDAPSTVSALMSTRAWPHSREQMFDGTGASPRWLHLVHGAAVKRWSHDDDTAVRPRADAAWTDEIGLACTVTAADCLPVLFSTSDGRAVAAAHAGWRGLAAGVLENTVAALRAGTGCDAADLVAWLGPCIGPEAFEVGADVLKAFAVNPGAPDPARFKLRIRSDGSPAWLANLPLLARDRLASVGVAQISGGSWCTVQDASRFFSFRRDGAAERMVAAVWRRN